MTSSKGPKKPPTGARVDITKRANAWWDNPEGLSGQQLRKIVQLKNNDDLDDLVHHPSKLGLSTDADTSKLYQTLDYIVTQSDENSLSKRLKAGTQLRKVALRHGDFTPLTETYRSIGGVTVFDEMLIRRAIKSRVPAKLESMENLRPHNRDKFHHLERFLPSMNKEMRALFVSVKSDGGSRPTEVSLKASADRKRMALALHPAEDLRSATDGGYVSWRLFMKELHDCTNKIVRGRDLAEFVDQSEQSVEEQLKKMRLKNVVTLVYDSPHLGGANHLVYSMRELTQLISEMEPEVRNSERRSFLSYLRWIDILLTSISNVRLREIISWKPLTYARVDDLRNSFEPENLARAPSLMYQPKFRVQKSELDVPSAASSQKQGSVQNPHEHDHHLIAAANSQMNTSDQTQLLWRRFHRDKLSGKFDRPRPLPSDIDEWRFEGSPPWLEGISKVQNRFQAVKSELSLQTIIKKTQRKVTTDNATDLLNQVHERWKKAERAKRVKYEKFLRRKKEEVFWTLRNPGWAERAVKRKKETFTDRYHQKKDVLRVNTWFPDLKDQCKVVMGTVKPMKIVERFGTVSWDHYNFALERLALVVCSMSSRDLTDLQMRAAGRFVLREVLGGPEDLMSRCFKFRGIPYELPLLRPGRGESLLLDVENIQNQPKSDDYRFYKKKAAGEPTVFASIVGMTTEGSDVPVFRHPQIDVRGSMKPISLPVRSHLPPRPTERLLMVNGS